MLFSNTIGLILALAPATIFAAPTKTVETLIADGFNKRTLPANVIKAIENGLCDLSAVTMPVAPTPLPPVGAGLSLAHVAVGRGTQNYTCTSNSPAATPSAVGAVASLFNATCSVVRAPAVLADVTRHALEYPIPTSELPQELLSGHHEFTAAGVPLFNLDTDANKWGYIMAKKNGSSNAPENAPKGANKLGSVPWLKLTAVEGDYKEVYRLNTAGGVAPANCSGITGSFSIEYAAEYWFFK